MKAVDMAIDKINFYYSYKKKDAYLCLKNKSLHGDNPCYAEDRKLCPIFDGGGKTLEQLEESSDSVMSDDNLSPCPFCSSGAVILVYDSLSEDLAMWAECQRGLIRSSARSTKTETIERWNDYCKFLCETGGEQMPSSLDWRSWGTRRHTFSHDGISVTAHVERKHSKTIQRWCARIIELGLSAYGGIPDEAEEKLSKMFATWIFLHGKSGSLKEELDRSGLKWRIKMPYGQSSDMGVVQEEHPTLPKQTTRMTTARRLDADARLKSSSSVEPCKRVDPAPNSVGVPCHICGEEALVNGEYANWIDCKAYCRVCIAKGEVDTKPATELGPVPIEPGWYWAKPQGQESEEEVVKIWRRNNGTLGVSRNEMYGIFALSDFVSWGSRVREWGKN